MKNPVLIRKVVELKIVLTFSMLLMLFAQCLYLAMYQLIVFFVLGMVQV